MPNASDHEKDTALPEEAEATRAPEDRHRDFISFQNFRYQKAYGNATLIALVGWLVIVVAIWFAAGFGWGFIAVGAGSGLLALFFIRTVVHARARTLVEDLEHYEEAEEVSEEELLELARGANADFFVSLVDGPYARQLRNRQR